MSRRAGDPAPQPKTLALETGPPRPGQVWRGQHPDGPGPGREARRQRDTSGRNEVMSPHYDLLSAGSLGR